MVQNFSFLSCLCGTLSPPEDTRGRNSFSLGEVDTLRGVVSTAAPANVARALQVNGDRGCRFEEGHLWALYWVIKITLLKLSFVSLTSTWALKMSFRGIN